MRFLFHNHPKITPALIPVLVLFVGTLLSFLLFTNVKILQYQSMILPSDTIVTTTHAVVFGAGMRSDGTQTQLQQDRVATAVQLLQKKNVTTLTFTGDDGQNRYDEVSAMKDQAITTYKISPKNIMVDPHGYRTYESCWRLKHVYQYDVMIAISQDFHLPRILYICNSLGIKTIGISANMRPYSGVWYHGYVAGVREVLARLKAWWQVEITEPLPRVIY